MYKAVTSVIVDKIVEQKQRDYKGQAYELFGYDFLRIPKPEQQAAGITTIQVASSENLSLDLGKEMFVIITDDPVIAK